MKQQSKKLSDLQSEFLRDFPHSPAKQKRALDTYKRARLKRESAQAALEKAKQNEYAASEQIVRTFGLQPVLIDSDVYDVACNGDTVFLIERYRNSPRKDK